MRGWVDGGAREALLPLTVIGRSGTRTEVEATVDTGFTGSLCLPPDVVGSLSLPFVGRGVAVLADGSAVETDYYRARVLWHGRERAVRVLVTQGGPLVGMTLLRGSVLTVAVSPGGEVTVEEA
ncbi:MAG: clan AA aspartic protease [Actinomycetota bacterium]|nr:clan AA aspartic protease [Actinomycetota bacterium]